MFALRSFLMACLGLIAMLSATCFDGGFARAEAEARSPVVRSNAEQWDVTSKITRRTYRIYVAPPVTTQAPPPGGYPVIYFIDGDVAFHTAVDAVTLQGMGREVEPAYVVGIGYGKDWETAARLRFVDLTPTPPDPVTLAALEASPMTKGVSYGEAEGFHRFLTTELRSRIEQAYPVNRNNSILWGHSLGGLFALHVLFNHAQSYRTFLINSPSINWNKGAVLQDEGKLVAQMAAGKIAPRVLFTVGEYEEKLADHVKMPPGVTREQRQAMLTSFGMVTNTVALADRLKAAKAPGGREIEAIVIEGETHLSVLPAAISRGLRFALRL